MKYGSQNQVRATVRVRVLLGLDIGLELVLGFELVFRLGLRLGLVMTVQILTVQIKTGNHETAAPTFWSMSIVVKRLDGSRCRLVWRYVSAQTTTQLPP